MHCWYLCILLLKAHHQPTACGTWLQQNEFIDCSFIGLNSPPLPNTMHFNGYTSGFFSISISLLSFFLNGLTCNMFFPLFHAEALLVYLVWGRMFSLIQMLCLFFTTITKSNTVPRVLFLNTIGNPSKLASILGLFRYKVFTMRELCFYNYFTISYQVTMFEARCSNCPLWGVTFRVVNGIDAHLAPWEIMQTKE